MGNHMCVCIATESTSRASELSVIGSGGQLPAAISGTPQRREYVAEISRITKKASGSSLRAVITTEAARQQPSRRNSATGQSLSIACESQKPATWPRLPPGLVCRSMVLSADPMVVIQRQQAIQRKERQQERQQQRMEQIEAKKVQAKKKEIKAKIDKCLNDVNLMGWLELWLTFHQLQDFKKQLRERVQGLENASPRPLATTILLEMHRGGHVNLYTNMIKKSLRWSPTAEQIDAITLSLEQSGMSIDALLVADRESVSRALKAAVQGLSNECFTAKQVSAYCWSLLKATQSTAGDLKDTEMACLGERMLLSRNAAEILMVTSAQTMSEWITAALAEIPDEDISVDTKETVHRRFASFMEEVGRGNSYKGKGYGHSYGHITQFKLSAEQQTVVTRTLIDTVPWYRLMLNYNKPSLGADIEAAVKVLLDTCHEAFQCPVCYDVMDPRDEDNVWRPLPKRNENWKKTPCEHSCCRTCAAQWCESQLGELNHSVKCPAVGCSYRLWNDDVKGLVCKETYESLLQRQKGDYRGHLMESLKDSTLKKWLKKHSRPCPKCSVIVSRIEGCDDMRCVCGCSFCYRCGKQGCGRGKKCIAGAAWRKFTSQSAQLG